MHFIVSFEQCEVQFTLFYLIFRLLANPSYYQLDPNGDPIQYICDLADSVIDTLQQHDCVSMQEDDVSIIARARS